MRTYPEYKDSGVEWIGEIPKGWIEKRFKHLNQVVYSGEWGVEPDGDQIENLVNVIRVTEFDYKKLKIKPRIPTIRSLVLETTSPKLVRYGDLILEKSGGGEKTPVGRLVMVRHDVTTPTINSNFTNLIRTDDRYTDPRFVTYLYHTCYNLGVTRRNIKQTTGIQNLFLYGIFDEKIFIPPLPEQKQISDYLDRKTQQIDDLIEKTERKIELLKEQRYSLINHCVTKGLEPNVEMKDSGVEWIGEIPKGWKLSRIKHVKSKEKYSLVDGPFGSDLKSEHFVDDGKVIVIESGFVTKGSFIQTRDFKKISYSHFEKVKRSQCKEGDIIIAKIGEYYGMSSVLPKLSSESVISGNSCKLTVSIEVNREFVHLFFILLRYKGVIQREVNQTGQPFISLDVINNLPILVPPRDEQDQIINFLNERLQNNDQIVDTETKRIDLLKEYRQSLISSAVTGKVRVTEDMI